MAVISDLYYTISSEDQSYDKRLGQTITLCVPVHPLLSDKSCFYLHGKRKSYFKPFYGTCLMFPSLTKQTETTIIWLSILVVSFCVCSHGTVSSHRSDVLWLRTWSTKLRHDWSQLKKRDSLIFSREMNHWVSAECLHAPHILHLQPALIYS